MTTLIEIGDYVRSHDFMDRIGDPSRPQCYIEGVVESIGWQHGMADCPRYKIKIQLRVWADKIDNAEGLLGKYAYPPINGTPTNIGPVTNYVELVRKRSEPHTGPLVT